MDVTRLVWPVASDEATITSQAAESLLPITNVQTTDRDLIFRTPSAASNDITLHWGGAQRPISAIMMFRHFCHGGSWQIRLYDDITCTSLLRDVFGGTAAIASNIALTGHTWGVDPTTQQYTDMTYYEQPAFAYCTLTLARAIKISLSGAPNTGKAYWEIGRLVAGKYWQPSRSPNFGDGPVVKNTDSRFRTFGANSHRSKGERWREVSMNFNAVSEDERAIWYDLAARMGETADGVLAMHVGRGGRLERDSLVNGSFQSHDAFPQILPRFWTHKMVWEEN